MDITPDTILVLPPEERGDALRALTLQQQTRLLYVADAGHLDALGGWMRLLATFCPPQHAERLQRHAAALRRALPTPAAILAKGFAARDAEWRAVDAEHGEAITRGLAILLAEMAARPRVDLGNIRMLKEIRDEWLKMRAVLNLPRGS
jgi:hypothetical protein